MFVCSFGKNQRILMPFSLLDLEMNGMNFANLTQLLLLLGLPRVYTGTRRVPVYTRRPTGTRAIYYPGNFLLPDTTRISELKKNNCVCPYNICSTKTLTFSFNNRLFICTAA